MTTLIDGRKYAHQIRHRVAEEVADLARSHGRTPGLATVLVGDDAASAVYVANKRRAIREAGMRNVHHALPRDTTQEEIAAVIDALGRDPDVTGILLQLPLPPGLDATALIDRIPAYKDVDGLTTLNVGLLTRGADGLRPCTPAGVMELLDREGVALSGAHAVVVGHSELVGRPMAQLLLQRDATVTVAHKHTRDLPSVTRTADILVVATGVPGLIGPEHVKPGAVVVDVGIHRTPRGLLGDVRTGQLDGLAALITPVPGGVGPMTIAMLLVNTLRAAQR
ncbi:bifunctional methylenetetrahydrofolate dehydrogenase/methenyltetrahydrofolate cyclohydrolase FolD [Streptomyces sp. NBC_00582]|uniref:bifunctional methylenetetrahydrofolate dehydrogenase/methenyltetrahydrofolate cyclohydrolase FolD n=1 Tax=Streptomyces sp. NBC_00582 TaxID=2975783 RepID=UPI002E7FC0C1|nr:bifunctional methylenetetrahydrofolate dehydrogenase/methenyltetrahydrofolate cyclohydrolase FolD [Streptomyces sp. NBC_00582]WUB67525.1 bifunctional methylenetetrahydrofolate dehydrogenase/methenyltetrahydrofolate cyclohydrolase FolD [Streptomyces sp. NBC_00582]